MHLNGLNNRVCACLHCYTVVVSRGKVAALARSRLRVTLEEHAKLLARSSGGKIVGMEDQA